MVVIEYLKGEFHVLNAWNYLLSIPGQFEPVLLVKFIYSEKATQFGEISTPLLTCTT